MSYLAVDDVDKRVAKAVKAGAKLMKPIFDVPDVGRIAILTGAGRRRRRLDDPILQPSRERMIEMKLYYFETLNPRKACAVARYLGSPVEFVRVDLAKGEHKTPEFLAINPNGKVPALTDGDSGSGRPTPSWPTSPRPSGPTCGRSDDRQIDVMRWLSWNCAAFHPPRRHALLPAHHQARTSSTRRPIPRQSRKRPASSSSSPQVLNDHLRGRKYLSATG